MPQRLSLGSTEPICHSDWSPHAVEPVLCNKRSRRRDFGLPVCSIEKEYINSASGQLRTRFQAFVESVEIKQIQEEGK